MSEWQKIETAPKDGRLVIVWESADRVYSASWWSAERWADENGGEPDEYQEGWFTDDEDELGPFYWMPLPEPPEITHERRAKPMIDAAFESGK
jgi:hypothetical protein